MTAVLSERRDQVLWLSINRPEKRNAINHEVIAGLRNGLREAAEDASVRVIVLTGVGDRAFCAGADLHSGALEFDYDRPQSTFADLLREGYRCPRPIVARVNGLCLAGGMGLLGMADVAVADEEARFGLPEVKVGLFPFQVLALLSRLVMPRLLHEWCLSGELFNSQTALDAGLVNHVARTGTLDDRTEWLLDRIVSKSPTAIARGKYAIRVMADLAFDARMSFGESQLPLMALTDDAREGRAAFAEHRAPKWKGQVP
ncbi:MAG: enoyl-CoA hydratase-related protein [Dehalococcoidia bacterium]